VAGKLAIAKLLFESRDILQVHVANALIEEQGEDVATKFGVIHPAPKEVGGLLQKCVKLSLSDPALGACLHRRSGPPPSIHAVCCRSRSDRCNIWLWPFPSHSVSLVALD